uniref:hypothetical protein n=1 Tax=Algoriphagus sp. TaxID=1872435 RepID=UPI00404735AA
MDVPKLNSSDVAILINSCDSYKEVVELNLCALDEFWKNCNYPIYINSETIQFYETDLNVTVLNLLPGRKKDWGARFIDSLSRIKEEFVIVILDDFILESYLNTKQLEYFIDKIKNNPSIGGFYLNFGNFILKYSHVLNLYMVDDSNYYSVNTGPAIWRKDVLMNLLEPSDNPWAWEFFAKYRKYARLYNICSVDQISNNLYDYNYTKGGAIYRGKWVKEVVEDKIKKYNLKINLNIRGTINLNEPIKRSLLWKINFFISGFKMVGFRSFNLFIYYVETKLKF